MDINFSTIVYVSQGRFFLNCLPPVERYKYTLVLKLCTSQGQAQEFMKGVHRCMQACPFINISAINDNL